MNDYLEGLVGLEEVKEFEVVEFPNDQPSHFLAFDNLGLLYLLAPDLLSISVHNLKALRAKKAHRKLVSSNAAQKLQIKQISKTDLANLKIISLICFEICFDLGLILKLHCEYC